MSAHESESESERGSVRVKDWGVGQWEHCVEVVYGGRSNSKWWAAGKGFDCIHRLVATSVGPVAVLRLV